VRRAFYVLLFAGASCQSLGGLSGAGTDEPDASTSDAAPADGAVDGSPQDGLAPDAADAAVGDADAAVADRIVFLSSDLYPGNFGGLANADASCQALAAQAGIPGTFRAWLGEVDGGSPATRMTRSFGSYVLVNGAVVATSFGGLLSATELMVAIDVDENGVQVAPTGVWTNTNEQGRPREVDCLRWSNATSNEFGRVTLTTTKKLVAEQIYACNNSMRFFCVEQ
jgi:hypothetical protein